MDTNTNIEKSSGSKLAIPASIVIAGLIVGGAVIYSNRIPGAGGTATVQEALGGESNSENPLENIVPVSSDDHIRGNPNAFIKIVEFSDTECPFCKRFHSTMQQAVQEYEGKVAWVYRHFPLDSLHAKARKEAEATECAAELGGNETFWKYIDRLFTVTPSNDGLDPAELPRIAEFVGLNREKFNDCLSSSKHAQKVEVQYQDAVRSGGTGTPFSILIAENGEKTVISGAQPYEAVKSAIVQYLKD